MKLDKVLNFVKFAPMRRREVILSLVYLAFAFAFVYYFAQAESDWSDSKMKKPVDCLYTSIGIQTGFGFTDGGAISTKMRSIVILQAFLAYAFIFSIG